MLSVRVVFLISILTSAITNIKMASFKGTSELESNVNEIRRLLDNLITTNELIDLKNFITQQSQTILTIDKRIEMIFEKSQIWATYEHYITSWIDQMSAVDRKLDIVIKSQERLTILETKLNTLNEQITKFDFDKFEHVVKQIEQFHQQDSTATTSKSSKSNDIFTLIDEYATRGVLSTLNRIESKIYEQKQKETQIEIYCNTSIDTISDIASKVDVIFDKMCTKYPELPESEAEVEAESQSASDGASDDASEDQDDTSRNNSNPNRKNNEETTTALIDCGEALDIFDLCTDVIKQHYELITCVKVNGNVWTLIQQRNDLYEQISFNRSWVEYLNGFGSVNGEFWAGNEYLHRVSKMNNLKLRIELEDFNGNHAWADYGHFHVSSASDNYILYVNDYRGNATDSLSLHNGVPFSTFDRNNDEAPDCCPCAVSFGSGWWFKKCFESNLNGIYHKNPTAIDYYNGIIWEGWLGNYSLRRTRMMISQV